MLSSTDVYSRTRISFHVKCYAFTLNCDVFQVIHNYNNIESRCHTIQECDLVLFCFFSVPIQRHFLLRRTVPYTHELDVEVTMEVHHLCHQWASVIFSLMGLSPIFPRFCTLFVASVPANFDEILGKTDISNYYASIEHCDFSLI